MPKASIGVAASLLVAASATGVSAADEFKLDYRIERTEATKLSLAQCTQILRQTAQAMAIPVSVSDESLPAVAVFGGLGDGKGSIVGLLHHGWGQDSPPRPRHRLPAGLHGRGLRRPRPSLSA